MSAIGLERVSAVIGYLLSKGDFRASSPNLPQRIAILGEANYANQSSLDLAAKAITSAQQAGDLYGYGSPIYSMARIHFPINGGGNGIPVIVYPQAQAPGATSKIVRITPAGLATGNGVHTVKIAGRANLDGGSYDININTGDTIAIVSGKIEDAVAAVLGCPVIATSYDYNVDLETKWRGKTADELQISIDTNGNSLGLNYTITSPQAGVATPSIGAALALFGNEWNTIVVNSYGTVASVMDALEAFNGRPDTVNPTGRFVGNIFKPFIAFTGSVADNPSTITDIRLNDQTISIAPAPGSSGFSFEAAANMAVLFSTISQNTPQGDVLNSQYPDMPAPVNIGSMADYNNRDAFVKKGCSTVELVAGRYSVLDLVTTYHPVGENPPQYRYCRDLMIDFNIEYGVYLLERQYMFGYTIAPDDADVSAEKVIKPRIWKKIMFQYALDITSRALSADSAFMQQSITVGLSSSNPNRIDTFFRYKRTGTARVISTEGQAGFNFGS